MDAVTAPSRLLALAEDVAGAYAGFPQVAGIALSGSATTGLAGAESDVDLYVYTKAPIPVAARISIVAPRAARADIAITFWEPGDEWVEAGSGMGADVMLRDVAWIEGELDRVLRRHAPSVGYSTAIWHNVRTSHPLFDRDGWLAGLLALAGAPYPEPLRTAIIAHNHPILRSTVSSYRRQIEKAAARSDWNSIAHRVAALLASYWDILFAVNRQTHPGEKRLVELAERWCPARPAGMAADVERLVRTAGAGDVLAAVDRLVDGLDALLVTEGITLQSWEALDGTNGGIRVYSR